MLALVHGLNTPYWIQYSREFSGPRLDVLCEDEIDWPVFAKFFVWD